MSKLQKLIIAFIRLSRIKVILKDYFVWLTIASLIASGLNIPIQIILLAVLTSLFVHLYAFIVNDCEDAEDDAKDPKKAKRNPISAGFITYKTGIYILQLTSFPALIIAFLTSGLSGLVVIFSGILLGHLYSWKKVRFKSMPVIDILSHIFSLSMFQVIYFLTLPGASITIGSICIILAAGFFSAGGALYNQLRDFDVDTLSGLNNTASFLGKKHAKLLASLFYVFGLIFGVLGIAERLFLK